MQDTYESEHVEEKLLPEAEMAVKVYFSQVNDGDCTQSMVEAEAVFFGGVLFTDVCVCVPSVRIWLRAHTAGNSYLAVAAPTWDEDGCSHFLQLWGVTSSLSIIGKSLGGSIGTWSSCEIPCPHFLSVYGVSSEVESSTFPSPGGHYSWLWENKWCYFWSVLQDGVN